MNHDNKDAVTLEGYCRFIFAKGMVCLKCKYLNPSLMVHLDSSSLQLLPAALHQPACIWNAAYMHTQAACHA
jgi:hypothetical protein